MNKPPKVVYPKSFNTEANVKSFVRAVFADFLTDHPEKLWYFMPSANGFGRAGIPDFVGVVNGQTFVVETKFGNNATTAHQDRELGAVTRAGGMAYIVRETTVDEFRNEFFAWASLCL